MNLSITPKAAKAIAKLPKRDAQALLAKLRTFAANPMAAHPWAKAFAANMGRIRQGDFRALYLIDAKGNVVVIEGVYNRKEAYR
jgi:mRNA-degrading endonuclease RelE of RelBE toxin-antitoxin system